MTDATTFDTFLRQLEQDRDFAELQAEMKPSRDIALLLVETRHRLGMTQGQFAKRAGVSQSYISQLESGTANPSIRKLAQLLRKGGINLSFEAIIAAPGKLDSNVESKAQEQVDSEHLTEGDAYHIFTVIGGLVEAIRRSRVDSVSLTREAVLGEVAARYEYGPATAVGDTRRPAASSRRGRSG